MRKNNSISILRKFSLALLIMILAVAVFQIVKTARIAKNNRIVASANAQVRETCGMEHSSCRGQDAVNCCSNYSCVFGKCQPNTPTNTGDNFMGGMLLTHYGCNEITERIYRAYWWGACLSGRCTAPTTCYNRLATNQYAVYWKELGTSTWNTAYQGDNGVAPSYSFSVKPNFTTPGKSVIFKVDLQGWESQVTSSFNYFSMDRSDYQNRYGTGQMVGPNNTPYGELFRDEQLTQRIGGYMFEIRPQPKVFYFKVANWPVGDRCGDGPCKQSHIWINDHRWCGDRLVHAPNSWGDNEQCDDGNNVNGDGCSQTCQRELTPTPTPAPKMACTTKQAFRNGTNLSTNSVVIRGETLRFRLNYRNSGSGTANNAGMWDFYDTNYLTFVSSPNNKCWQNANGHANLIQCDIGNVIANNGGFVEYDMRVKDTAPAGTFRNSGMANWMQPECSIDLRVNALIPTPTRIVTPTPTRVITPTPTVAAKKISYKFRVVAYKNGQVNIIHRTTADPSAAVSTLYYYRWDNGTRPFTDVPTGTTGYTRRTSLTVYPGANIQSSVPDTGLTLGRYYFYKLCAVLRTGATVCSDGWGVDAANARVMMDIKTGVASNEVDTLDINY